MKFIAFLLWLFVSPLLVFAQTTINPATQIRWPVITGTVDPAAPTWPCTSAKYGQPYTNVTTGALFTCGASGWVNTSTPYPSAGIPLSTGTAWGGSFAPGAASTTLVSDGTVWTDRRLTQDDIAPGFTINSFTGGSNIEIGATVTNPAFTASYSTTPASAQITNTDGISSPLVLTTPFTSGTVTGAFTKTTATSTTFTLTAIGAVTKTATQAINWQPRTFGGVGTTGATTCTASGNNCVLVTATGTLTGAALNNQTLYGPYTPSGQKVYILMIGGSHTFKDNATGFAFAFNAPTSISFVNQFGATVTMFLYESTNTLTGTFSVLVAS